MLMFDPFRIASSGKRCRVLPGAISEESGG